MNGLIDVKPIEERVGELHTRYLKIEEQIKDLEFYKECCMEKFVEVAKGFLSMDFPYTLDFYEPLLKKSHEKHKSRTEFVEGIISECLCTDIKITECNSYGYSTYRVSICFTAKEQEYELVIPIPKNMSRHCIVYGDSVDWDIIKFKLLKRESEYCWEHVWSGYDLHECKYFWEDNQ